MDTDLVFYEKDALLYRLNEGLKKSDKNVVFVVGAPLTAPYEAVPGVSDVAGVIELIRTAFKGQDSQLEKLDAKLAAAVNRYQ